MKIISAKFTYMQSALYIQSLEIMSFAYTLLIILTILNNLWIFLKILSLEGKETAFSCILVISKAELLSNKNVTFLEE